MVLSVPASVGFAIVKQAPEVKPEGAAVASE